MCASLLSEYGIPNDVERLIWSCFQAKDIENLFHAALKAQPTILNETLQSLTPFARFSPAQMDKVCAAGNAHGAFHLLTILSSRPCEDKCQEYFVSACLCRDSSAIFDVLAASFHFTPQNVETICLTALGVLPPHVKRWLDAWGAP